MKAKKSKKPNKTSKANKAIKDNKPVITVDGQEYTIWKWPGDAHDLFVTDTEKELVDDFINETNDASVKAKSFFDGETVITNPSYREMFDRVQKQKPTTESIIVESNGTGMVITADHHKDGDWSGVVAEVLEANSYKRRKVYLGLDPDGGAYFNDGMTEIKLGNCRIYDLYVMLNYFFEHAEKGHMSERIIYHKDRK